MLLGGLKKSIFTTNHTKYRNGEQRTSGVKPVLFCLSSFVWFLRLAGRVGSQLDLGAYSQAGAWPTQGLPTGALGFPSSLRSERLEIQYLFTTKITSHTKGGVWKREFGPLPCTGFPISPGVRFEKLWVSLSQEPGRDLQLHRAAYFQDQSLACS